MDAQIRGRTRVRLAAALALAGATLAGKARAADPNPGLAEKLCALVSAEEVRTTLGLDKQGAMTAGNPWVNQVYCKYGAPNAAGVRFDTGSPAENFALHKKAFAAKTVKDLPGLGDQAFVVSPGGSFRPVSVWVLKGKTEVMVSSTNTTEEKTIALTKKILAKL